MAACIFCGQAATNTPREHIWPESLGGDDGMLLSPGKMCGACNNYFGRAVEAPALQSFPFDMMRAFGSIVSKKGKWHTIGAVGGWVQGSPGGPSFTPRTPAMLKRIQDGLPISLTFLASPSDPLAICRLLLKMGVQLLAESGVAVHELERFAAAREFARRPRPGATWWFALDTSRLGTHLRGQTTEDERHTEVWITNLDEADDAQMVAVRAYGFFLFAPLVPWLILPPELTADAMQDTQYHRVQV